MARYKDPDVMGNLPKDEWDACMLGDNDYTDSLVSPERWERALQSVFRDFAMHNYKPEDVPGFTLEERARYLAFLRQWKSEHGNQD
jgi:hypothetical protein